MWVHGRGPSLHHQHALVNDLVPPHLHFFFLFILLLIDRFVVSRVHGEAYFRDLSMNQFSNQIPAVNGLSNLTKLYDFLVIH